MAEDGGEMMASGPCSEEVDPIVVGFQNPEGDPNGSFPEYSIAGQAGADYINAELGGLGGRCIELEVCAMAITPDDSQRCANEIAAAGAEIVVSSLNFFGNHFPIYQGSNIPVIVGTPITIGDFATPGVFAIGAGGGCFGVHTGLVQFATQILPDVAGIDVNRVGVPWADTPLAWSATTTSRQSPSTSSRAPSSRRPLRCSPPTRTSSTSVCRFFRLPLT